jgi:hypothetical protein
LAGKRPRLPPFSAVNRKKTNGLASWASPLGIEHVSSSKA